MTADFAAAPHLPVSQPRALTLRLSIMMFLQWGMFGLWIPLAGVVILTSTSKGGLGFTQAQLGWIMGISGSIGALAAPFIAGQIADRYFSTERLMAVLLLIGGVLWWVMSEQQASPLWPALSMTGGVQRLLAWLGLSATPQSARFASWLALSVMGSLALAPTGALSNSLAFAQMTDPTKQFPVVRVWGTIGWIVTGWVFSWLWLMKIVYCSWSWPFVHLHEGVTLTFVPPFRSGAKHADVMARMLDSLKAGAIVAFVYAAYCLTLPNTPPKRDAVDRFAFRKAFRLFRRRSFLVLMVAALLIACVHNIFFMQASPLLKHIGVREAYIGLAMSVGQIAEIAMIAVLGWLLKGLGMRTVLTMGGVAYLLRFLFLGSTWLPTWAIVTSLGLHGVCFACYYAAAFIYVDRLAEPDIRHTAQTLFGILIGIGPVIGGALNGFLGGLFVLDSKTPDYTGYWYAVAAIGGLAAIVLALFFRDETKKDEPAG